MYMKEKTKREKILTSNKYYTGLYLVAFFVMLLIGIFINRLFMFVAPSFVILGIVCGILTDASYTFSSKAQSIVFSVFCFLILNFYAGILALKMTDKELEAKINKFKKYEKTPVKKEHYISSPAVMTTEDKKIETIKKYKKLFDEGVITEEEFEKKKKQLLS